MNADSENDMQSGTKMQSEHRFKYESDQPVSELDTDALHQIEALSGLAMFHLRLGTTAHLRTLRDQMNRELKAKPQIKAERYAGREETSRPLA